MGQIPEGVLRNWTDGDEVTGDMLDQEFAILRAAINDNYNRLVSQAPAEYFTAYSNILNHMVDTNLHRDWGNYKFAGTAKNDFRAYEKNILTSYDTSVGDKVTFNPNNNFANGIEFKNKVFFPDLPYVYGKRQSVNTAPGLWGIDFDITTMKGGFTKSSGNPYLFIVPQTGIYRISYNIAIDGLAASKWGEIILRIANSSDVATLDRQLGFVGGTGIATLHYISGAIDVEIPKDNRVGLMLRNQDVVNRAMSGYASITFIG